MKKAFCLLLAILLAAPLWTLPGTAAGEKPVITAPADGNVLAAGDVTNPLDSGIRRGLLHGQHPLH